MTAMMALGLCQFEEGPSRPRAFSAIGGVEDGLAEDGLAEETHASALGGER